jgi:hypothetical protein
VSTTGDNMKIEKKRYGQWAGNPRGTAYNPEKCAHEVHSPDGWRWYQCSRKNGHGPDELFCKQHAKLYEKE